MKDCLIVCDLESMLYTVCTTKDENDKYDFSKYVVDIDTRINEMLAKYNTNKYLLFVDNNQPTFRHKEYDTYKSNRDPSPLNKPMFFYELKKHVIKKWEACISNVGLESDDECLIAKNHYDKAYDVVIAHIDKDLKQLPGKFYNYNAKVEEIITAEQAYLNLWTQVLTGDSSDSIRGIPGIGPVKANEILSSNPTLDYSHKVWMAYSEKFGLFKGSKEMLKTLTLVNIIKRVEDAADVCSYNGVPGVRVLQAPESEDMLF